MKSNYEYYIQGFNDAKLGRHQKNKDEIIEELKKRKYNSVDDLFEIKRLARDLVRVPKITCFSIAGNKAGSKFKFTLLVGLVGQELGDTIRFYGDSAEECEQKLLKWANDEH